MTAYNTEHHTASKRLCRKSPDFWVTNDLGNTRLGDRYWP